MTHLLVVLDASVLIGAIEESSAPSLPDVPPFSGPEICRITLSAVAKGRLNTKGIITQEAVNVAVLHVAKNTAPSAQPLMTQALHQIVHLVNSGSAPSALGADPVANRGGYEDTYAAAALFEPDFLISLRPELPEQIGPSLVLHPTKFLRLLANRTF